MTPALRCLALVGLILVVGGPLEGQTDPHQIPRRPRLPADRDSNNSRDYFYYGVSQLNRDPEKAASAFFWASRIDPYWADPLYGRFVALLLAQPPSRLDAYITRSSARARDRTFLAIDSVAYSALLLNPWVDRRIEAVLLSTWVDRITQGEVTLTQLQFDNPELSAWMAYANARFEDAIKAYRTVLARRPNDADLHLARALPFVAMGLNDSALVATRGALAALRVSTEESFSYVGYPFLEYSVGVLFERGNQPDSARAAYERALLDDLTFYPAHRRLALLRLVAGDTTGALAELEQAATLAPHDAVSLYEFAVVSLSANRPDSGLALLRRASEANPFFLSPHLALARLYDRSSFFEEAIEEYRHFLSLAPRTLTAQVNAIRARVDSLAAMVSKP